MTLNSVAAELNDTKDATKKLHPSPFSRCIWQGNFINCIVNVFLFYEAFYETDRVN